MYKLKLALTLDEMVDRIHFSAGQGWKQGQMAGKFNGRHPQSSGKADVHLQLEETGSPVDRNPAGSHSVSGNIRNGAIYNAHWVQTLLTTYIMGWTYLLEIIFLFIRISFVWRESCYSTDIWFQFG
jgi:hypothetical protein